MNRRIKVLQFITTTIGGAGEHVLMLASGLDPARYDVTVSFSPGCALDEDFSKAGLRVVPIEMRRTGGALSSLNAYKALMRLLTAEHFDIVHTHTSVAGAIGRLAAKQAQVPVVLHMIHAYACHPYVAQPWRRLYLQLERWLDRYTDHYIAGSEYMRNYGIRNRIVHPDKITRIYNALRRERIRDPLPQNEARKTLGLPLGVPIAGAIARLERQKGIVYFIRAVPTILQRIPQSHFVICGDGPLRETLRSEAQRLSISSRVHFLEWQTDVTNVFSALDVMVLPSLWEAFGIVNLEAMAMALPVVASRVGGIPEIVRDGESGFLVASGESEPLAFALIELLGNRDLSRKMGLCGQELALEHFSEGFLVTEHQALYQRLMNDASQYSRKLS